MKKWFFGLLVFLLVGSIHINTAYAGNVTLTWNAPTTNVDGTPITGLAGYKVYLGPSSGVYSTQITIGNVNLYTVTLLPAGTYYFAVTAYNTAGGESAFSNEVSKPLTQADPAAPYGLKEQ